MGCFLLAYCEDPSVGCCSHSQARVHQTPRHGLISAPFEHVPLGKREHVPRGSGGCGDAGWSLAPGPAALRSADRTHPDLPVCGSSPFPLHLHQHGPRDFRRPISGGYVMCVALSRTSGATRSFPGLSAVSLTRVSGNVADRQTGGQASLGPGGR